LQIILKTTNGVGILGLFVILFVAVQLILGGIYEIEPKYVPEFFIRFI
jgi:hypothetical protein